MRVTAENLAAALFQASPDCVKILDRDGRLLDMNPCGRSAMEIEDFAALHDRPWISLWPEEERSLVAAAREDARIGRAGHFEGDCPTAGGAPRHWEVSVLPIRDATGDVVRILATSRDVTEKKRRETVLTRRLDEQQAALVSLIGQLDAERRRVEETRSQISHTEKLRVLGRFVGSVVHDINNVLASMAGAARLLRRRAEDARSVEILDHVDRAVDRGARLVRQLLDFSRRSESEPEPVDLAAALATDGELLRHLVGRSVGMTIDVEDGIWPVLIAPGRLQSVLFNLVANARDAIGAASGRVRIVVRNRASLARAAGLPPGDWVEISVIDDGPGMPPDVVARLGEPFFTTKEAGAGTGLGIPSAFDLAEQAGGRVEIDSLVGRGTRVSLHLPRSGADLRSIDAPSDAAVDPAPHGGATILLVESEAILRNRLTGLLRGLGYTVVEAPDTATAAAVFAAGLGIDLVVSDLHLGADSGLDVARTARRDRPDLPVVFLSGTEGMSEPIGEPVLRKPIDERRLTQVLLERLGRVPASHLARTALISSDRLRGRIRDPRIAAVYEGWRTIAGATGRLPSVAATGDLGRDLGLGRHLIEVEGDAEFPVFVFREAGDDISTRLGRPLAESRVTTEDEDAFGSLGQAFRRALRGGASHDHLRTRLPDGRIRLVERLLLPLSDDGEHLTHLLGVAFFDDVAPSPGADA